MNKLKKKKVSFSAADIILIILAVTAVLSVVFHSQIQSLLGEKDEAIAEYSFVIEYVSDTSQNRPITGETIYEAETGDILGKITAINETKETYSSENSGSADFYTLRCEAECDVTRTDSGAVAESTPIKAGARIKAKTDTASFVLTVVAAKIQTK